MAFTDLKRIRGAWNVLFQMAALENVINVPSVQGHILGMTFTLEAPMGVCMGHRDGD